MRNVLLILLLMVSNIINAQIRDIINIGGGLLKSKTKNKSESVVLESKIPAKKIDTISTKISPVDTTKRKEQSIGMIDTAETSGLSKMYGTKKEKDFQDNLEGNFGIGRAVFVGYPRFYANQFSIYMQSEMHFGLDDTEDSPNVDRYDFTKKGAYMGKVKVPKIYSSFNFDKNDRIKSVRISGDLQELINLFLSYWPSSVQWKDEMQFKKGVVATKQFWGDLITFTYKDQPIITITSDSSFKYDPNQ